MSRSVSEIESEIARTRAELGAAVDELSDRLDPRLQARATLTEAQAALADVRRRLTGQLRMPDEPEPTRRGWIALGAAVAAVAAVGAAIARRS